MSMPRSVEEILAHADRLAGQFEDYEPQPGDDVDRAAIAALRAAVRERSEAERHVRDSVRSARQAGVSWSAIGALLGTSGEAARQRYRREDAGVGPTD